MKNLLFNMDTEARKQGVELSMLAKLLFDKGVALWAWVLWIEVAAGLLAAVSGLINLSDQWSIILAIIGFLLLASAYYFKIRFENIYDNAETMRRQSVLTDALGWPIGKTQFSEWRLLAGKKVIARLETTEEDPDYFATKVDIGAKRFLEMTQESAFWTRHLYCYLRKIAWIFFVVAVIFFFLVLTTAATDVVSRGVALKVVYAVYLLLPLVLVVDVLGWAIRLGRLINSIGQIEKDMEKLSNENPLDEKKVLRLVFEYNCQVVSGIPIPGWVFKRQHDYIADLWKKNQ